MAKKMAKNLMQLLIEHKVEIPMLQRDYAQGRVSQKNIAKRFLDAIFEVLEGKRANLHIDFIYGYHENGKFLLLDGQQRLTTLWLLYFYFYKKFGRFDEAKNWLKNSAKTSCKKMLI